MKRVILAAAIAAALAASTAMAQDKPQPQNPQNPPKETSQSQQAPASSMHGTITSVDNSAKSFVLKDDASGKEVTVYWDGSTKVNGDLKVGSTVSIQTTDQSGRMVATSIDTKGAKKPY